MKKYAGFITGFALMCMIPAVIYFVFPDHAHENIGELPSGQRASGLSTAMVQQSGVYQVTLTPQQIPLKTGKQTLNLLLQRRSNDATAPQKPNVQATMAMGNETMNAPIRVKAKSDQRFSVDTDFSMAGTWHIAVKPDASGPIISFLVPVQN